MTLYYLNRFKNEVNEILPDPDPQYNYETLFYQKVDAFVDAVLKGGKAPIPSEQIIKNQAILDGIVRSSELKDLINSNSQTTQEIEESEE